VHVQDVDADVLVIEELSDAHLGEINQHKTASEQGQCNNWYPKEHAIVVMSTIVWYFS